MPPFVIEEGDTVQARKHTPQGVIPLEFTVTTITEGIIGGSPLGDLDPEDGWTFEIVRKLDPGLPATLSDLAVWTIYDPVEPIRTVGPTGGVWSLPGGGTLDPSIVLAWMPWADLPPVEAELEEDDQPEIAH